SRFTDPDTPASYTLSLHDALPISAGCCMKALVQMMKYPDSQLPAKSASAARKCPHRPSRRSPNTRRPRKLDSRKNANSPSIARRSEEHTSELQSLTNLVCRLLLQK